MKNEYILNEVKKFISENPDVDFIVKIGKGVVICEKLDIPSVYFDTNSEIARRKSSDRDTTTYLRRG